MRSALGLVLTIALGLTACATYREDLNRGQRMYEDNQYERALALWRALEDDADSLTVNDQARYAYLRGMTDYRLGFRPDARHWLAIARATEVAHPGGLNAEWKERMTQALDDLNKDAYGGERFDTSQSRALETTTAAPGDSSSVAPTPAPSSVPSKNGACRANADCPAGQICDGKWCTPL